MRARRAGFTLIELMVAMALTLFIMVILTQAFVLGLETFSAAKGIGDMQQNLRVATVLLRDDLSNDHFEGKRRLSDINIVTEKPQAGFVSVLQGSAATYEGNDPNGLPSFRAVDHVLYMTVKRRGNRQEQFFNTAFLAASAGDQTAMDAFFQAHQSDPGMSANTPPHVAGMNPGRYSSQWAEVMYYLQRTGSTEQPNNPNDTTGTPTFSLMRAEFVMVPSERAVSTTIPAGSQAMFQAISCNPSGANLQFYSPADAAQGQRLVPVGVALGSQAARIAPVSTLVLANVLSFEIQMMRAGDIAFLPATATTTYDTAQFGAAGYTNNFGLKAIQITLRVFDAKTRQTRQVTLVQDM